MKTRVTELLGIEQPIIQGAMAWIADARLAAAVSNAGGLGIIACGSAPLSWVREQVELARTLTDKPFGVNIMLMNPEAPQLAELLAELRVPVITTGAGNPGNYIDRWKEAGAKVVPVVASSALAKRISIPVIAAGGVADGRGLVAAFALGAEAVQIGTRFLTAYECGIHEAYKQKVLAAKDSDTIVTGRDNGHPVRQLKNKFSRGIRKMEADTQVSADEVEAALAGSLHRAVEGDVDNGSLMSGQVACLIGDEKSAQEIVDDFMREALAWSKSDLQAMADANAGRAWNN